ncbi:YchF family ATPase [Candidatus Curtissbacteria bacterium]|nr:YchF family ATPase [Candidatus Curtissbacteria bacterium]
MSSLSVGIIGMPNAGKSTLFNALLRRQVAQVAEYPYTTIEPNVGVVEVPDERLTLIAQRLTIAKIVPAAIKFIDIAGLIKGAHKGEGLGNQFLGHIREVDAILHIVRAFENPAVDHVAGKIDSLADIGIVNLELEMAEVKKPTIYILNVSENQLKFTPMKQIFGKIKDIYKSKVLMVCAKLEAELSEISTEEQKQYLTELGINKSGLDQVIAESYKLLDLITFFTVTGGHQAQAWPIKKGSKMIEAAEIVHTDFAHGFIACEVISWDQLVEAGSRPEGRGSPLAAWVAAKEKGFVKIAGRDQVVEDGDVVEFKFKS